MIHLYKGRGFEGTVALMDNKFRPLIMPLAALGVNVNLCAADEHIPEIERAIS